MRIAVIGGGIFGVTAAVELAKDFHTVTLFEKNVEILQGATPRSQNRLHLGLHYPRDLATAKQSILGFKEFGDVFGDAVFSGFPNYYAIPKHSSKVDPSEFVEFCTVAGIKISPVSDGPVLPNGVKVKNISGLWTCGEGVIDMKILREILKDMLTKQKIEVQLGTEVSSLVEVASGWTLESNSGTLGRFDLVVRCTYSSDSIELHSQNFIPFPRIFHKTLIQVIESTQNRFGLTIIDGDFLTILPQGFSKKLLSYGPSISTRQKAESYLRPLDWVDSSKTDIIDFQSQMKTRIDHWLENWDYEITSEYLETIRTIAVGVESTDRRTSHVKNSAPRLIEVWSGKIDHAVEISKLIPKMVSHF